MLEKSQANATPDGIALVVVVLPEVFAVPPFVAPASLALASPPPPPPPHAAVNETAARRRAIAVGRSALEMSWVIDLTSQNIA
jgi:hypothetical protein